MLRKNEIAGGGWLAWTGSFPPELPRSTRINWLLRQELDGSSRYNNSELEIRDTNFSISNTNVVAWRIAKPAADESAQARPPQPLLPLPVVDVMRDEEAVQVAREVLEAGLAVNPKDAIGAVKLPMHLWPAEATALGCLGMLEGAAKYGRNNFVAADGVVASIYIDAAMRHLAAWFAGENNAPDSGIPHLGHALATIAIVVKCQAHGKLIDDRDFSPLAEGAAFRKWIEELTPHVKRVQQMYADKNPRHFTIADVKQPEPA